MPTWLLEKLARSGGLIGIQIGNEFHNPPVFNWRAAHAGKPFWDTARISEEAIPIESVDDIVQPQFPMEGCAAPRRNSLDGRRLAPGDGPSDRTGR